MPSSSHSQNSFVPFIHAHTDTVQCVSPFLLGTKTWRILSLTHTQSILQSIQPQPTITVTIVVILISLNNDNNWLAKIIIVIIIIVGGSLYNIKRIESIYLITQSVSSGRTEGLKHKNSNQQYGSLLLVLQVSPHHVSSLL